MNAIAPPPKRALGTGTVSFHRGTGKWRYRLPGGRSERGGFSTAGEASAALDAHRAGHDPRLVELRHRVRRVLDLAAAVGVNVEKEIAAARTERLIEWARARRRGGAQSNNDRGGP